jgi:hypothetical protein
LSSRPCWVWPSRLRQPTRFANPTDQGNAPCTSSGTPCSLDEAVTAAVCGDTIQLDPGTYNGAYHRAVVHRGREEPTMSEPTAGLSATS